MIAVLRPQRDLPMKLPSLLTGLALALVGICAAADGVKLGNITIAHPIARATAPGQPTGGAFLTLENHGADDRLLSVSSAVSKSVELHSMAMQGDVMRMREVNAIDLPAGKTVELKPGGLHIMLVGLKAPLKAGERFAMKLRFEKAGEVTIDVPVEAVGTPRR